MSPEGRRFYLRYQLLTLILPPYLMAAVFYGAAWLIGPGGLGGCALRLGLLTPLQGASCAVSGLFLFVGLSRIFSWLGFLLSGVPKARVIPSPEQESRLSELASAMAESGMSAIPLLVELGPVPYLAAGGLVGSELWLSTHTLATTPDGVLRALTAHELGHLAAGPWRFGCAWPDLCWIVAYPLAYVLRDNPALFLLAALLQAWLILRLELWLRLRAESKADRWAARSVGREDYARALAAYLAQFEAPPGAARLRRRRLRGLGLSASEISAVLEG